MMAEKLSTRSFYMTKDNNVKIIAWILGNSKLIKLYLCIIISEYT